jgi:uncharacterized damage-inducible protein DinB
MTFSRMAITALHAGLHDCLEVVLVHMSGIPPGLLAQELTGFGRPTVREQFAHILSTEAGWVCGLQSLPIRRVDPATLSTTDDFRQVKKDTMAATFAYLDSIGEHQLNTELESYPEGWIGPHRSPAFILLHVITHGFHHKGQIVAMLRLLGYPAPDTDLQRA